MKYFTTLFFSMFLGLSTALSGKPLVECVLKGQMGNQMFQIATATSLALDNNAIATFPDLVTSKEFNIPANFRVVFPHLETQRLKRVSKHYVDTLMPYRKIPYTPNMRIEGWFQSEKYFKHHRDEIVELFAPSAEVYDYVMDRYGEILNHHCTVALHHRSYLKEDPTQGYHPTQPKSYFLKAIAHYPEDARFVVCSNDIEWCKRNFADIPREFVYIENAPRPKDYHDCYDFYLMSLCTHQIVTNSSFSWWSAYLNTNPDKIVTAPKLWLAKTSGCDTRDVIPDSWIAIDP